MTEPESSSSHGQCAIPGCGAPGHTHVVVGARRYLLCERHQVMMRETGRELAHTAARAAGAYVAKKAPLVMQVGAALFDAVRAHQQRSATEPEGSR